MMNGKLLIPAGILSVIPNAGATAMKPQKQPNILMIIADDMRPELSCYGHSEVISPNIDALARSGTRFTNAYCNAPVSGASRASLLTGIRPLGERFHSFEAKVENDAPGALTIPGYLKQNGYTTLSYNKVFHHQEDHDADWDVNWRPEGSWRNYVQEDHINSEKEGRVYSTECADVPDNAYFDGMTSERAIADLKKYSAAGKPFFMAVGFVKPHLPFNAPKKYWDLYEEDEISLPDNFTLKNNSIPKEAFHTWGELRFYEDMPSKGKGQVPEKDAKRLIHGYHACVSYTDAQIGKVLSALHDLGLDDDTVVIFFGDHGWSLGEHGEWCKHSTFDIVMNAPLIVRVPGEGKGRTVESVVEFVDIFPTICSVTGLEAPSQLQGESLLPLVKGDEKSWKNTAVIQWNNSFAAVTPDYGYTQWRGPEGETLTDMLFDHTTDKAENYNVASDRKNSGTVSRLRKIIEKYIGIAKKW